MNRNMKFAKRNANNPMDPIASGNMDVSAISKANKLRLEMDLLQELLDKSDTDMNRLRKKNAILKAERDYFQAECIRLQLRNVELESAGEVMHTSLHEAMIAMDQMRNQRLQ